MMKREKKDSLVIGEGIRQRLENIEITAEF